MGNAATERRGGTVSRFVRSILAGVVCFVAWNAQAAVSPQGEEKPRLVIFPIRASGLPPGEALPVRTLLRDVVEATGAFTVMNDGTMNSLFRELGFIDLEDCVLPSCIALVGNKLSVDRVLHASLERRDSLHILILRLVDVAQSRIVYEGRQQYFGRPESLTRVQLDEIANGLAATTVESVNPYRWYLVGGAILVAGTVVYFLGKGLFGDKERHFEDAPKDPPPPPGN